MIQRFLGSLLSLLYTMFLLHISEHTVAQSKIDSLRQVFDKEASDTHRVNALYMYADLYRVKNALIFKEYLDKGMALAQKLNYKLGIAEGYRRTGTHYRMQSNYDRGTDFFLKALKMFEELNHQAGIAKCYNHLGLVFERQLLRATKKDRQIFYDKATIYYSNAREVYKKLQKKRELLKSYIKLGNLNTIYKAYNKAQTIYNEGIALATKYDLPSAQADLYFYKGDAFIEERKYEQALKYMSLAVEQYKATNNVSGIGIVYMQMGRVYEKQAKPIQAEKWYYQSLRIAQKTNNTYYMATNYLYLARLHIVSQAYVEAYQLLDTCIQVSQRVGNVNRLMQAYVQKIKIDTLLNDSRAAFRDQSLYYRLKDSVFNARKNRQLTEVLAKFESQKKENENQLLKKDNLLQKKAIRQQYTITVAIAVVLALVIFFLIGFIRVNQQLKKKKNQISKQNDLLQDQKEQILHQNEELKQTGEELVASQEFLKEKHTALEKTSRALEAKSTQLRKSVKSGLTIQQALFPSTTRLKTHLAEYFVLYRPKDVVSGDFYWFSIVKGNPAQPVKLLLAAVDCTGHGIPGAFMSMIGNILLDRIVDVEKITDPAAILNRLDTLIMSVLKQQETQDSNGMDIGLVLLERSLTDNQVEVTYANARRPLYYIKAPQSDVSKLEVLKEQRTWIGGDFSNKENFVNQELLLHKGDLMYLSSDGYADQNNSQRQKLKETSIKQLLDKHAHTSLDEQKQLLEQILDDHMVGTTQRDDILVWGIRV